MGGRDHTDIKEQSETGHHPRAVARDGWVRTKPRVIRVIRVIRAIMVIRAIRIIRAIRVIRAVRLLGLLK